jgi:hypothetical protein
MRLQHKVMVGLNMTLVPIKYSWHRNQMENKDITRMPMEGRFYHINYDTLIDKEG